MDHTIEYSPGKKNPADGLSRLKHPETAGAILAVMTRSQAALANPTIAVEDTQPPLVTLNPDVLMTDQTTQLATSEVPGALVTDPASYDAPGRSRR